MEYCFCICDETIKIWDLSDPKFSIFTIRELSGCVILMEILLLTPMIKQLKFGI